MIEMRIVTLSISLIVTVNAGGIELGRKVILEDDLSQALQFSLVFSAKVAHLRAETITLDQTGEEEDRDEQREKKRGNGEVGHGWKKDQDSVHNLKGSKRDRATMRRGQGLVSE